MPTTYRSLASALLAGLLLAAAAGACGGDDDQPTIDAPSGAADAADEVDAADQAAQFCSDYETTCGYGNSFGGNPYTDLADCTSRFNSYGASRQACVIQHLGFAAAGSASLHCTHAEGLDPCV